MKLTLEHINHIKQSAWRQLSHPPVHDPVLLNTALKFLLPPPSESGDSVSPSEEDILAFFKEIEGSKNWACCKLCYAVTSHKGTKLCDSCWECTKCVPYRGSQHFWNQTPDGVSHLHTVISLSQNLLNAPEALK